MKLYDIIVEGYVFDEEEEVIGFVKNFDWSEVETTEREIPLYHRYVDTVDKIKIYYDFGADYYFFEDLTNQ